MRTIFRSNLMGKQLWVLCASVVVTAFVVVPSAFGQAKPHRFYNAFLPPGYIGQTKARFEEGLAGYIQPVEVIGPKGSVISVAEGTDFRAFAQRMNAGLQIGYVYRLKVEQITELIGAEIYPTIELIDRLYPPEGQAWRFPVTVEVTEEDIKLALSGRLVTRVIYLESSDFPNPDISADEQYSLNVTTNEDPLQVAETYGRPMAILRMGSIAPGPGGLDEAFVFGSPPVAFASQTYSASGVTEYETLGPNVIYDETPLSVPDALPVEVVPPVGTIVEPVVPKQETLPSVEGVPEPDATNPFLDDVV